MDTKNEDTIVRQIERSLSNNLNENLFTAGREYDNKIPKEKEEDDKQKEGFASSMEYPLVSGDYINNNAITVSRAEYIRQAREACLRQLSGVQVYSHPYDVNYMEADNKEVEGINHKKEKALRLFHEEEKQEEAVKTENSPQEAAAFRALIIRMVTAIVIFISVFVIDKFHIVIGKLTPDIIQAYITGKDTLKQLEDFVVAWLK